MKSTNLEDGNEEQIIKYPVITNKSQMKWVSADVYFNKDVKSACEEQIKEVNTMSLAEIMAGFFRFYAQNFEVFK